LKNTGSHQALPQSVHWIAQAEENFHWLSDFTDGSQARPKPVLKACVHCKKAHLACDNERPCKRYGATRSTVVVAGALFNSRTLLHPYYAVGGARAGAFTLAARPRASTSCTKSAGGPARKRTSRPPACPLVRFRMRVACFATCLAHIHPPFQKRCARSGYIPPKQSAQGNGSGAAAGSASGGGGRPAPSGTALGPSQEEVHAAAQRYFDSITGGNRPVSVAQAQWASDAAGGLGDRVTTPVGMPALQEPEILAMLTLDGVFTFVSPECEILLNLRSADMLGHSIYEYMLGEDVWTVSQLHRAATDRAIDQALNRATVRVKHAAGHYVPVEIAMTPYRNAMTGRIESLLCGFRPLVAATVHHHQPVRAQHARARVRGGLRLWRRTDRPRMPPTPRTGPGRCCRTATGKRTCWPRWPAGRAACPRLAAAAVACRSARRRP